jgi:hypothetical protein
MSPASAGLIAFLKAWASAASRCAPLRWIAQALSSLRRPSRSRGSRGLHRNARGDHAAMPRNATFLAIALLGLTATGCSGAGAEPSDQEVVLGQGGPYLSAVDTATVAQAYREIRLVCTKSLRATNGIEPKVRAASAVARRYPDKIFRSGTSDHARPVVDTMADMAGQLRACGHAKLATRLFSRRREQS